MHGLYNLDILGVPGTVFFICALVWIPVMFALLGDNPVAGVIAAVLSYLTGKAFVIGSDFVRNFNFGPFEVFVFIVCVILTIVAFLLVYGGDIARWMRGPVRFDGGVEQEIFLPEPWEQNQQQGRPVPYHPGRRQ
jgi:hypothetical protein